MHEYPIQDYALIGNCETAALINSDGGIDWLCLPAFDAPSFFGALLDREQGGEFSIRPADAYRVERRYIEDTAILETRFVTGQGTVRLTDFFVIARDPHARFYDFTSLHPTRKLVRLLELENGAEAVIDLRVAARRDYARRPPTWRRVEGGFECAEAALFSNLPLVEREGDIALRFTLEAGRACFFALDGAQTRRPPDAEAVRQWLRITQAFWREWNLFNYYRGPHQKIIRRSAVTLKLLTYAPSGAIVAAPTTSLPERLGGDLNWDYRYTWVRDTAQKRDNAIDDIFHAIKFAKRRIRADDTIGENPAQPFVAAGVDHDWFADDSQQPLVRRGVHVRMVAAELQIRQ